MNAPDRAALIADAEAWLTFTDPQSDAALTALVTNLAGAVLAAAGREKAAYERGFFHARNIALGAASGWRLDEQDAWSQDEKRGGNEAARRIYNAIGNAALSAALALASPDVASDEA